MKKIAVMPVKNEEWIIEYNLRCAEKFFDHIIVADQNSTDRTEEICRKFNKVILIKNNQTTYNEGERRQLLLNAARDFDGYNFITNIAADEIFSANIIEDNVFQRLVNGQKTGTAFSFQWVQLWKHPRLYRDDKSVWSRLYRPFSFIDDRKTDYAAGFAHLSIVPEAYVPNAIVSEEIKILHYQFVDFKRMLAKQRWARLLEFGKYTQPTILKSIILNNKYFITKDESNIELKEVQEEWISRYEEFFQANYDEPWHVQESISMMNKYGIDNLKWLDIWDYEWPGIADSRNFIQNKYHQNQKLVSILNEKIPKPIKNLIKKI